jgi:hypothetical protein
MEFTGYVTPRAARRQPGARTKSGAEAHALQARRDFVAAHDGAKHLDCAGSPALFMRLAIPPPAAHSPMIFTNTRFRRPPSNSP